MQKVTNIKCRVCQSNEIEYMFKSFNTHGRKIVNQDEVFELCRCNNCGLVFLNNMKIDDAYYEKYYTTDYYLDEKNIKGVLSNIIRIISVFSVKRKIKIIDKSLGDRDEKISILDVGCGSGDFLLKLDSKKFEKFGCEISKEGYEICVKKGLDVFNRDLEGLNLGEKKFDVITLWHVLEHIGNPVPIFNKINCILKDDGVLVIQTPNTEGLGFKIGGKYWFHLDSPRHLALYNEKCFKKLCEESGFKLISTRNEFYDYPLDLFWSIRKSYLKYLIIPLYPLFKLFSREHLTFVCKKR